MAASCAGVASPSMIAPTADSAWSCDGPHPPTRAAMAARIGSLNADLLPGRDERSVLPRCHPPSVRPARGRTIPHSVDRAHGSIRRRPRAGLTAPPALCGEVVDGYSSRSTPCSLVARESGPDRCAVKARLVRHDLRDQERGIGHAGDSGASHTRSSSTSGSPPPNIRVMPSRGWIARGRDRRTRSAPTTRSISSWRWARPAW